MKKLIQKAVKVLAFLLVLALCYRLMDQVLKIKTDDMVSMVKLRQLPPDTVDVLLVGSSHIGMNIDNQQIYDEFGIPSFDLWVGMQPLWNSYYYLKEALRYQKPKVVMVDVFLAGTSAEYSLNTVAMKNIQYLSMGVDKLKAALDSFPAWQDAVEAVWGMPFYHERYDELVQDDWNLQYGKDELSLSAPRQVEGVTTALKMLDYRSITNVTPLTEKNERYLRKLIALCKQENIPLVLLASPFEATEEEASRFNTVAQIAAEEGIPFLNFLKTYDEEGIDAASDFYDRGHLNNDGIAKFSHILGQYLADHYELRDCRTIDGFIWNKDDTQIAENAPVFALQNVFDGDGASENYDTGVKLYGNRYDSWTLLTRIGLPLPGADENQVIMACFDEQDSANYHGLLMRGDGGAISIVLGNNRAYLMPMIDTDSATIAITKNNDLYSIYLNGEKIFTDEQLPCDAYSGTLLLGCEELTPGGEKFRFSPTRVLNLEVYDSVLKDSEILAWQPEDLPEAPKPLGVGVKDEAEVYTLPEQFVGGVETYRQASYLDTQTRLFASTATRFTLLTSVTPSENPGNGVFLSCFDENAKNYRGLLIRQLDNAQINIVFGQNVGVTVPGEFDRETHLAIVKDGKNYRIYADGQLVAEAESPAESYDGTLLIGAQRDADGNIFRISKTRVNHLSLYAGVMTEADIAAYDFAAAPLPPELVAESAAYTMPGAFVGNGSDRALDTGVKLYDVATKDWTLDTVIDVRKGVNNGVYMSCFSEEIGHYRGFMLRQDNADTLTVYVGNSVGVTVDLSQGASLMHLVVVKSGSQYTIWQDGELVQRVESACDNYDATLLLGAQRDADGNLFRFSNAGIRTLNITDGALSETDAAALSAPVKDNSRF